MYISVLAACCCLFNGVGCGGRKDTDKESEEEGETYHEAAAREPEGTVRKPGSTWSFAGIEFVWIPQGTFQMGSRLSENDRSEDDGPLHAVEISKGFWLGRYELTKAQWKAVMGTEPWQLQYCVLGDLRSPAVYVSWGDAQAYIARLNARGKGHFRLPTEAEWEYACRAGTQTQFYYGDDPSYSLIGKYAWGSGNTVYAGRDYALPIGQKKPNAWGLYDMYGNVWEWCQDWYDKEYYAKSPETDPKGPSSGHRRVVRGGGFNFGPETMRSARRGAEVPGRVYYNLGFRVARDP